jgi:hypothetical protein
MLSVLGRAAKLCDGISRREMLRVGGLSLFGSMTLPRLLAAREAKQTAKREGKAKSVVLFNLLGGPSHMDMFDMKPLAPVEIRGEFTPIDSSLPGLQVCEHLPNTAKYMDRATVIRTVTHNYNAHNPLAMMTGWTEGGFQQLRPEPTDPPDIGAICQYLEMGPRDMPGAVCMPCYPGWGETVNYPGIRRPGPYGGFLGHQYDPLFSECNPTFNRKPSRPHYDPVRAIGEPTLPRLGDLPEMTVDRFDRRRSVLSQLDGEFARVGSSPAVDGLIVFQKRAFEMLSSSKVRGAFDLSGESNETRERYGQHLMGSCMLVARRLVEAGVPFISVHTEIFGNNGHSYDMHENNFGMLKNENLPVLDMVYPALVQDLEDRGLLDSTLVVVMGEMGRAPRVNAQAGRDHWPRCGFSLMTGGGVKKGSIFGSTDKQAAYPASNPVSPGDVVATIYHLLGIDHHLMVPDRSGRPIAIAHGGEPIWDVIA